MNARSKSTAVPKLSYLQVSKLKKSNRNREKLFNFWNLVLLTTFHLNDRKNKRHREFKSLAFVKQFWRSHPLGKQCDWIYYAKKIFHEEQTLISILKTTLCEVKGAEKVCGSHSKLNFTNAIYLLLVL